ncbi:MAG: copper homeostasis protein CutC [Saprospiraceae bacterium]|nr:copper homeostasis protein CutC [Saprospiraceae bacterium]
MSYIIEACAETLETCKSAFHNGANQLELCSRLDLDGLTPSFELAERVIKSVSCPVKIMIRSREGDFYYSDEEIADMKKTIDEFKKLDVGGFVFGALSDSGVDGGSIGLDLHNIQQICSIASPYPVTLHKAIDFCSYPLKEIHRIGKLKIINSILSSGGKESAVDGILMLNEMYHVAATYSIDIIAAGKITGNNLPYLKSKTKISHFHGKQITNFH